jgi:hypothetical protein
MQRGRVFSHVASTLLSRLSGGASARSRPIKCTTSSAFVLEFGRLAWRRSMSTADWGEAMLIRTRDLADAPAGVCLWRAHRFDDGRPGTGGLQRRLGVDS